MMRLPFRRDPITDQIIHDVVSLGFNVKTLKEVSEIENPTSQLYRLLESWATRVPAKYTHRIMVTMDAVAERLWPTPVLTETLDELVARFQAGVPFSRAGVTALWQVGDEIYRKYSDRRFDDIVALVQDVRYFADRQMLVLALGKSKRPEAVDVLLGLLDDEGVSGHATEALAKLGSEKAREGLTKMLDDESPWVRKSARRGLAKLDQLRDQGS